MKNNRRLTPAKVRNLREQFAKPAKYGTREDRIAAAATKHGVAPNTIRNLVSGRTYKDCAGPITAGRAPLAQAA